jgi:hypothetical protein
MEGNIARMEEMKNVSNSLIGKPERDHLQDLGVDGKIRMDLREIGRKVSDWFRLAQWRALVNTVMNIRVP